MAERVGTAGGVSLTPAETTVGIIGGTGALGRGLAKRLMPVVAAVKVGSRDLERAKSVADLIGPPVEGVSNRQACRADVVVVAVPWSTHDDVLVELAPRLEGRVVIDAVNPLGFDERGPFALKVPAGSAAERAQELLAGSVVVGAFHHVAAATLASDEALDLDVMVVGDDRAAISTVSGVIDAVAGLRAVYAGRLRNAGQVEALTANLIAVNRRYRTEAGLRFTGLDG